MKTRILSLLLALVMLVGLLPTVAAAEEEDEPHNHDGWHEVTMDPDKPYGIRIDGVPKDGLRQLEDGNFYLGGNITTSLTIAGTSKLCLNGYSITRDSNAVNVSRGAEVTIFDCAAEGTNKTLQLNYFPSGEVTLDGAAIKSADRAIYHNGDFLHIEDGTVEGFVEVAEGVFTMTGGSVTYKGSKRHGAVILSAGSISGGKIRNEYEYGYGIEID